MTLSALRLQRCRGLYRGGCGFCGSLCHLLRIVVRMPHPQKAAWPSAFRNRICFNAAAHRLRESQNSLSQPSSNLRIFRWGRELRLGWCDGCDDCDGIFDTDPGVILIVTTVTNRHKEILTKLIKLPFRVRFMVYSMPYSLRNSPALTLSLRVRMLGCRSSLRRATSSVALPFHTGFSSVITAAILSSRGSGGCFQSSVSVWSSNHISFSSSLVR